MQRQIAHTRRRSARIRLRLSRPTEHLDLNPTLLQAFKNHLNTRMVSFLIWMAQTITIGELEVVRAAARALNMDALVCSLDGEPVYNTPLNNIMGLERS